MKQTATVIFVGQAPPPYTGQAIVIDRLRAELSEHYHIEHIRMGYSDSLAGVGRFSLKKVGELGRIIREAIRLLRLYPDAILYYPPASAAWVPILRDGIFLLCVRPFCKKLVFHYHAFGLPEFLDVKRFPHRWLRNSYCEADLAVVPTEATQSFPAKRRVVVPSGVDVPQVPAPFEEDSVCRILYVGILSEEKGLFDLIDTVEALWRADIPITVTCVGLWRSAQEQERAEACIAEKGLQQVICFTGGKTDDDLWREYAQADLFFFPTHYPLETQGMVVVEAMAFGLPVVASCWHGPEEVVVDGETGILCPPEDVDSYTQALRRLAGSPVRRQRMGEAGRARYEELYTTSTCTATWVKLIEELHETS